MRQIYWQKPTDAQIIAFLDTQRALPFSYTVVGASRQAKIPIGYVADHNRVQLGQGIDCFEQAKAALTAWRHFPPGWTQICWPNAPLATGTVVGLLVRGYGFWWLNSCRVVYIIDEQATHAHNEWSRFGFAYGTLPGHVEQGEERFLLEWNQQDGSVWYDIFAFSQPKHLLVKLAYPLARRLQQCFARDSKAAMSKEAQK